MQENLARLWRDETGLLNQVIQIVECMEGRPFDATPRASKANRQNPPPRPFDRVLFAVV
jgi:hypothetical protein